MLDESDPAPDFNPQRLRVARERRGLTKEALATMCGVSRRAVTDWESGKVLAPPIDRISGALGFDPLFFFGEELEQVGIDAVSFRALSSTTQRQIGRVLANATLMQRFSTWFEGRYRIPGLDVPSFEELTASFREDEPSPVDAATSLRLMWGLGSKPIPDMLALVESHGVWVFSLPSEDKEVDAFSYWHEQRAVIFLNAAKSAERLRFDLAHELGHLCMHKEIKTNRNRRYELDANSFASSFLIPRVGLVPQIVNRLTLQDVMRLKRYWRVSATAMVRRLMQLGRITEWQYRSWMIDLSERGFRTSEPDGLPREQSDLLRQILTLAREDGWTLGRLSTELSIPKADLSAALLGLTVTPLVGASATPRVHGALPPHSGSSQLRIVR